MAVITVSNEFGTQSQELGEQLAKSLGYECIGDQLLAQIAKELHLSEHEADTFRQASKSSILRFVDRFTCSIVQKVVDRESGCLDDNKYYEKTKELVEKLYENDNVIILGWGAQCILKSKPKTLHVRLIKDNDLKIDTLMSARKVTREAAQQIIKQEEDDLKSYIQTYFKQNWSDAKLYDLVIDMGKTTVEQAVNLIMENVKFKQ